MEIVFGRVSGEIMSKSTQFLEKKENNRKTMQIIFIIYINNFIFLKEMCVK